MKRDTRHLLRAWSRQDGVFYWSEPPIVSFDDFFCVAAPMDWGKYATHPDECIGDRRCPYIHSVVRAHGEIL